MNLITTVKYSCEECGLHDIDVEVPARENEPVLVWMDMLIIFIGADHFKRSPDCHTDKLSEVKIPASGTDRVGGAVVN